MPVKTQRPKRQRPTRRQNLRAQLAQLEEAQLLRPLIDEEPTYIFRHTLTQESAYQSLLQKQLREIHRTVAEVYEKIYTARELGEFAARLTEHYAHAGNDAKTLFYATGAGDGAFSVYANTEAIVFYRTALEVAWKGAGTTVQLIHLYTRLGRAFELLGDYDRALANYAEMQSLAREHGDRAVELEALMLRATAHAVGGHRIDFAKAHALSMEAMKLAQDLGNRPAQARIYWNLLLCNRFGNEGPAKAVEYAENSLAISRELGLKEQLALTSKDIDIAYIAAGQFSRARASEAEAILLWRELDNKPFLAESLAASGISYFGRGELEQAIRLGEESYALNEAIGNRWGLAYSASQLYYAYGARGEMEHAIRLGEQALDFGEESAQTTILAMGVQLAVTLGSVGAMERAFVRAQRALASPIGKSSRRGIFPRAVLAWLHLQRGDLAAAEELLAPFQPKSFMEYLRVFPLTIGPWMTLSTFAELALTQGDTAHATEILDDMLSSLAEMEERLFVPPTLHQKARVLLAQNRVDEAHALLTEARRAAEDMQTRFYLWQILAVLSKVEAELGNAALAESVRKDAHDVIQFIAAHTPPELRAAFLNLPDVLRVMAE